MEKWTLGRDTSNCVCKLVFRDYLGYKIPPWMWVAMHCEPGKHKRTRANTSILAMFLCCQGLVDKLSSFIPCLNDIVLHNVSKIIDSDELAQKPLEAGSKVNISYLKGFFFCYFIRERKWVTQNVTYDFTCENAFVF